MERFSREQAHTLSLDDIKELIRNDISNPCLDRLLFVETRPTKKQERKIFPVYPFEIMDGKEGKVLVLFVVQFVMKQYNTACITIPESDIGTKCRFWNLPPHNYVMEDMPMTDSAEVQ